MFCFLCGLRGQWSSVLCQTVPHNGVYILLTHYFLFHDSDFQYIINFEGTDFVALLPPLTCLVSCLVLNCSDFEVKRSRSKGLCVLN